MRRPPVTILKPVRGVEPRLAENLRSFCAQDYPEFEVVFGVLDPADPALTSSRRVAAEHPGRATVVSGDGVARAPQPEDRDARADAAAREARAARDLRQRHARRAGLPRSGRRARSTTTASAPRRASIAANPPTTASRRGSARCGSPSSSRRRRSSRSRSNR